MFGRPRHRGAPQRVGEGSKYRGTVPDETDDRAPAPADAVGDDERGGTPAAKATPRAQAAKPAAARAKETSSRAPKAGAAKTGTAKAGAAKTGAAKTGSAKSGAAKTGAAKSAAPKTSAANAARTASTTAKKPAPRKPAPKKQSPKTPASKTPAPSSPDVAEARSPEAAPETLEHTPAPVPEQLSEPEAAEGAPAAEARPIPPKPTMSAKDAAAAVRAPEASAPPVVVPDAEHDAPADEPAPARPIDASAPPALSLLDVHKSYGSTKAVRGLDLTVPAGVFFGLVGPNGAGKTTTISIATGLLRPDNGRVAIAGVDVAQRAREAKRMLGVLPDGLESFDRLTGRQILLTHAGLRRVDRRAARARIDQLGRELDLEAALSRPAAEYSTGMRKKLLLAGALIHAPRLLVLDEPFEGVDPHSSRVILRLLQAFVDGGGTVVLSSHGLGLVERVCSHVAVLVEGRVIAQGPMADICAGASLEERFGDLVERGDEQEGFAWLRAFSA